MYAHPLLPDPTCLTLERIPIENGVIVFAARTLAVSAVCPCCGHSSDRLHSRYRRTLLDLPWQGNAVRVVLTVRRFFCDNQNCERRIFAERPAKVAQRYARKTSRLAEALRELAFLAGAEAAARIARTFGLLVSPDALLHNLRRSPQLLAPTPRVLGVDDFAFRRGHRYGTILVDLEKHRPVDVLPDREASTLSAWLKAHPGVEIISRDRGNAYIEGATNGAPNAVQIADRWHLLKNLGDVLERFLSRHHRHLRETAKTLADAQAQVEADEKIMTPVIVMSVLTPAQECKRQERMERRSAREAIYQHVRQLYRQGCSQMEISRRTGLARQTIRKFLKAESCPQYPEQRRRTRATLVAPFAPYLKHRWEEGCHNAAQLLVELRARGYSGQYSVLKDYLRTWRATDALSTSGGGGKYRRDVPSASAVRWWLLGHFTTADTEEQAWQRDFLETLVRLCPEIGDVQQRTAEFGQIVKERQEFAFDAWLAAVNACTVPELRSFAKGLLQDEAAVRAALASEWSNGQTEGQVNRLKTIKRSMYGRASFDLLRARVLHHSAA